MRWKANGEERQNASGDHGRARTLHASRKKDTPGKVAPPPVLVFPTTQPRLVHASSIERVLKTVRSKLGAALGRLSRFSVTKTNPIVMHGLLGAMAAAPP